MKDYFPTPTGAKGTDLGEEYPPNMIGRERRVMRCWNCGFAGIDIDRDNLSHEHVDITYPSTVFGSATVQVPTVGSGCPFCASSLSAFGPNRRGPSK